MAAAVHAAAEIAGLVEQVFGRLTDFIVTAIPCGHSRRSDCFGKSLARQVAAALGAPFVELWADRLAKGTSHPRRAPNLRPLEWTSELPARPIIVVDDVATSGHHMEEALSALRERGATAIGIAWISGTIGSLLTDLEIQEGRPQRWRPARRRPRRRVDPRQYELDL